MSQPQKSVILLSAMPRREGHEVREGHVGNWIYIYIYLTTVFVGALMSYSNGQRTEGTKKSTLDSTTFFAVGNLPLKLHRRQHNNMNLLSH